MRIGLDARALLEPLKGVGRYVLEMVRHLQLLGHELVLYAPDSALHGQYDWSLVDLKAHKLPNRWAKLFWGELSLPWQATFDGLDIFWGPNHRLPLVLPPKLPRVVTIHDLVWKYAAETMRRDAWYLERALMPLAVWSAHRIIADSYSTEHGLLETFEFSKGKIRVVHLGMNPPIKTDDTHLTGLAIHSPYALFVGTAEPRKNLYRLLQAFAGIPDAVRSNLRLVLVASTGWGGQDVRTWVDDLGLQQAVIHLGFVSDEVLENLYAHARFVCYPSLYEGFGLPLLEGMKYGVPALTADVASIPEVAGDAAVYINPLSVDSIQAGFIQMLTQDLSDLRSKALVRAKLFSWQRTALETTKVFTEVLRK
jgi:glycosyltransferase involved in cell wall biosynthesis